LPARPETRHQNGRRYEAGGKLNPWSLLPLEAVIPFRDFGQQALPARSGRHWAEPFRASRIGLARGRKRLPPQSNLKGGIWPRPRRGLFSMKSSHRTINQVQSNRWGAARRPPRPATSSDRAHRRPAPLPQRDPHVDVSNPVLLNQRCPLALSFESMFRARMLKILLQYLPQLMHRNKRRDGYGISSSEFRRGMAAKAGDLD
jgi:hypothetical protein